MSASATLNDLKDINPRWFIEDYSLWYFIGIVVFFVIIVVLVALYIKKLRTQKIQNKLRVNINIFCTIEANDLKTFAYESTKILNKILPAFDIKYKNNPFIKKHSEDSILDIKTKIKDFIKKTNNYKYKPDSEKIVEKDLLEEYKILQKQLNAYI